MRKLSRLIRTAPVACLLLVLAVGPAAAQAAEPATVTVRVEGFGGQTLLPQTEVTTTTTPVPVEGGTCSGTSAGGAIYDAVKGNWQARESSFGVELLGIDGVDLPPFGSENYAYWSFWVNNAFASQGVCGEQLTQGEHVLLFGQCFGKGTYCPSSESAPEHLLTSNPPSRAAVAVGESVSVAIGSLATSSGVPEPSLPAGTTLSDGSHPVAPDAGGTATISFAAPGLYTLQAHAPNSVPSDPQLVCVHQGEDGNCGTNGPQGGVQGFKEAAAYKGPFALVARQSAPLDGHVYRHSSAPRVLSGTVAGHSAVQAVELELHRRFKGRCSAFDGTRARFTQYRCGSGPFFQVSTSASWSYQLPSALPRGRYVLDVQARDAAGNTTSLARGTSRIVFYVD